MTQIIYDRLFMTLVNASDGVVSIGVVSWESVRKGRRVWTLPADGRRETAPVSRVQLVHVDGLALVIGEDRS